MCLQELDDVAVREYDLSIGELVLSLVVDENRDEINKLDNSLLDMVYLGSFNGD